MTAFDRPGGLLQTHLLPRVDPKPPSRRAARFTGRASQFLSTVVSDAVGVALNDWGPGDREFGFGFWGCWQLLVLTLLPNPPPASSYASPSNSRSTPKTPTHPRRRQARPLGPLQDPRGRLPPPRAAGGRGRPRPQHPLAAAVALRDGGQQPPPSGDAGVQQRAAAGGAGGCGGGARCVWATRPAVYVLGAHCVCVF